jgi:CubicO group peptidase (beta-lactamase class C family)
VSARQVLDHTAGIVDARRATYGPPDKVMAATAARWSLTLGRPVTPAQVVLCMIDLKLARLARDPGYRDGVVDVIGYASLLPEVLE